MQLRFEELPLPGYVPDPTPEDLVATLDLYRVIMRDDYGKDIRGRRALTLYDLRTATTYVTRDDESDKVLAVANLNLAYRLKGTSLLNGLAVHPDYQRQGIGAFTMNELAQETARHQLDTLRVRSLPNAIGFYAQLGFVCDEIIAADPTMPYMSLPVRTAVRHAAEAQLAQN